MNLKKSNFSHIGIDLMGSDIDPIKAIKEIISFFKKKEYLKLTFFITKEFSKELKIYKNSFIDFFEAEYAVSMEDNPLLSIRRKKKSSVFEGLRYLKDGKIDAFISSGNTGALTVGCKTILKTIKPIKRPALLAIIPTKHNLAAIIDVGANISNNYKSLIENALLGSAFQKAREIKNPKVGLLNIGSEKMKGTFHHKKAYFELSKHKNINFIGNIEGKEVFEGKVDVLITDGFTGNIFLKTSEGLASFVLDKIYHDISKEDKRDEIVTILKDLKKRLYYGEYPGALLLGSEKIIIKCHGNSSVEAINSAILSSEKFIKKNIITSIKNYLK